MPARMFSALLQRSRSGIALVLVATLFGCGTAPKEVEKQATYAATRTGDTFLGRRVSALGDPGDGRSGFHIIDNGIEALQAIWHRGAVDADGKTGDGAGIHVQIPQAFFDEQVRRTGHEPRGDKLAVGQIFLPRSDFAAQEAARTIVETEVLRMGYYIYGWRHVPVDISCLGDKANATRPEIEQILIANSKDVSEETFERELYVIRRRIEGGSELAVDRVDGELGRAGTASSAEWPHSHTHADVVRHAQGRRRGDRWCFVRACDRARTAPASQWPVRWWAVSFYYARGCKIIL